ncbi:MAG: ATP-binding protein [Dehalococcoidia bacterium]
MRFLTNLTLWKKITLLTTVGLLLGLGVFSSLGLRAVDRATEAMLNERLTTAGLVADYLDEALERALVELRRAASTIAIDGAGEDLASQLAALEQVYSRLSIYTHGIYLANEDGQVIWSLPEEPKPAALDMRTLSVIGDGAGEVETGVSGLATAPLSDTPVIFLASATGGGEEKGIVAVAIDLGRSGMGGFIKPIRLGQTGYVEIVDQNGLVVARTEPGPEPAPFEESDHGGRFAALIAEGKPTRGVCHTWPESDQKVHRKDVLAFVPLSSANWGVVVRQSEGEALAPTRELRMRLLIFGAVLVSIAVLFVVVTTRDVGGRIRMLTAASQRMAGGDLTSPFAPLGKDEVGVLSQSLDDMRVKLKTSHDELEQKTHELSSLLSVSEILTSTLSLPGLFDAIVAKAVEIISGADGGMLVLQRVGSDTLIVQCAVGLESFGLDKKSLSSQVVRSVGELSPESVPEGEGEAPKDTVQEAVTALLEADPLRSVARSSISAEVFHGSRHIGSIVLISSRDNNVFSGSDRRLLQAIADGIALAVERYQLAKEAEEARALHEADRLRAQLISSVSHELRTPLTLIKGYSTSLLRKDVSWDLETQGEFLQIIDEKTDELRDLIDKILLSAKLEAGALKLEKEPLLVPRLAQKVVDEISSRWQKHRFTIEFPPTFPVVEADVRCVEQVLRNLVENAVKYSPAGGKVSVEGEVKDDQLVVSVRDEGVGIPPEHREKVFDRFYRVRDQLTRRSPGSGLGLSIVRGHVEAHGGRVWLDSTAGKGTTFHFSLPLNGAQDSE